MKTILGLDLGTNSIGWALIRQDFENKAGKILGLGSRIIPMSQDILGEFGKGNSVSQTASRTQYRGTRRLRERHLLRRERLHRVLNILGFLPQHYAENIDFEQRLGKFLGDTEPKLPYDSSGFIFKDSFEEMLLDLGRTGFSEKVPYDWTIYYLRKKALSEKIRKEELAWILLNFNQKRGYYQLRGEEEEDKNNRLVEFYSLRIVDVRPDDEVNSKGEIWYSLELQNGWTYRRSSKIPLFDWKDKTRDFIVTTELNDDGSIKTDKDGFEKRSFRAPAENDWTLIKKKTEQDISRSEKTVGAFIYEALLENPKQKIKGKLVRTVERKFYKSELTQILKKQIEFHAELQDMALYDNCVRELYRNNEAHQLILGKKDFEYLFTKDIIFYQRPLKSKKSSISNCTQEYRKFKDSKGTWHTGYLKTIPKSNPYYQEYRLWQWILTLSLYRKDDDKNVTAEFLRSVEDHEKLFDFLNSRRETDQKALLKHFKLSDKTHRWNYVEDKKYPCNETRSQIAGRLARVENAPDDFLTREKEQQLWHIIYSITDPVEFEKALGSFAEKNGLDQDSFVRNFIKIPPFNADYGAYSEKAIKKLLPLMRMGKYWDWKAIDHNTKDRIDKIITGEIDSSITGTVREKAVENNLTEESKFQGLLPWLAVYVVYGSAVATNKYNSAEDLENYLKEFKQHSLRNPIVEQIITETVRVVKDIWQYYGNGEKDFFDEIHIELGREMKNTAEERKRISSAITQNENKNLRIKTMLAEMLSYPEVENVRPYSPMQQDALKIFEEGVLNSNIDIPADIEKISKTAQPTKKELLRYKLWIEQKYRSPYTGQVIPLNKLFTPAYQIEHVIPQSRFFDDSLSNKVICESAVNTLKDNQTGYAFIKNHRGQKIATGFGSDITLLSLPEYEAFVKDNYAKNRRKKDKLLMEDVPEKMIERQMNDTRYISKFISSILSNIVRAENNDDSINSKNVLTGNGTITSTLRQDWGLNDLWNQLILPRFERLNYLTKTNDFTAWNENHQKKLPTVPLELSKDFQKKRIDHRHHAIDALVIACATRNHINLLNNKYARSKERFDLNRKLRKTEVTEYTNPGTGERVKREVPKSFLMPWETFHSDTRSSIESVIISFKQNLRVINKASNKYESYKDAEGNIRKDKDGKPVKDFIAQTRGNNWAIRKPMHKEFVYGKVELSFVKAPKGKIITAIRKNVDATFDLKTIMSITDTGIQKILKNYLQSKDNKPELAFSPEGLEEMNNDIKNYNDGKPHQPIYKVRIFEVGSRFGLGQTGSKANKYAEAAKGTNLFFAVYEDEKGKRNYETLPLNEVIEHQKWKASLPVEEQKSIAQLPVKAEKGKFLFSLSPNDLVYVFQPETYDNVTSTIDTKHIYKVVSFSGNQCFFVRHDIAYPIVNKMEYSPLNKMERSMEGIMIKENCYKLKVDRLGSIINRS